MSILVRWLSLGVNVVVLVVVSYGFIKVLKNDLKHLSSDVKEIKEDIKKSIIPKIFNLIDRISRVEGKLNGK